MTDLALMEESLCALGDTDILPALFDRFFEAFPEQRPAFINLEAASARMTNETIEAMMGLADGAPWVETTIVNFVDLHRNYGPIPHDQYAAFVDMTVTAMEAAADPPWCLAQTKVWHSHASALKSMIEQACLARPPHDSLFLKGASHVQDPA